MNILICFERLKVIDIDHRLAHHVLFRGVIALCSWALIHFISLLCRNTPASVMDIDGSKPLRNDFSIQIMKYVFVLPA
jgi:hypothetical protein